MKHRPFPMIDLAATGENIVRLRRERGMSVRDLQDYFGFDQPQAIYKWQSGKSLPSVDNLYALGALFQVPMDAILVSTAPQQSTEPQDISCGSAAYAGCLSLKLWLKPPAKKLREGGNYAKIEAVHSGKGWRVWPKQISTG